MLYPVSETFLSPQGEGYWAGTLMYFIRLAGCTVGKPFSKDRYNTSESGHPFLPIYTEQCTTHDGRHFECDTDFRVKERLSPLELVGRIPENVKHICITGGEPMMHDLGPLTALLQLHGKQTHIETSGTIKQLYPFLWITVSPKWGVLDEMLNAAAEIKLLVDKEFNANKLPHLILTHPCVYIQPINHENSVNQENINLCLELQQKHPQWKISVQLHKVLGVR